jgi:PAS domain S-box-containing protein
MTNGQQQEFQDMYNDAPVGLWRTDLLNGRLLHANHITASILGYETTDELTNYVNAGGYKDDGFREALTNALKHGEVNELEVPLKRKDGTTIWVSLSARSYPDKGYIEGSVRDISNEKVFAQCILPYIDRVTILKQHIKDRLDQYTPSKIA